MARGNILVFLPCTPGFLGNEKSEGRQRMQETWKHISDGLIFVLKRDPRVRPDAFTERFQQKNLQMSCFP